MTVRAKRVWMKGEAEEEEIVIENEKPYSSGRFSNVSAATLTKPSNRRVAVKRAWESKDAIAAGIQYKHEATVLASLYHPHVTRLLYYFTQKIQGDTCHSMVLDFFPLDMSRLRDKGIRLDSLDARLYAWQLWCAVEYVSEKGFLHLDIKPANLIVDHDKGIMQLADFGNAKKLIDGDKNEPYQVTDYILYSTFLLYVTRFYRAPELLFGTTSFTHGIDWWAAACVTAEFSTSKPLLKDKSADAQMRLIIHIFGYPTTEEIKKMKVSRPRVSKPKVPRGIKPILDCDSPPELLSLLQSCLVYSPDARMKPGNVINQEYFKPLFTSPPPVRSNGFPIPKLANSVSESDEPSKNEEKKEKSVE